MRGGNDQLHDPSFLSLLGYTSDLSSLAPFPGLSIVLWITPNYYFNLKKTFVPLSAILGELCVAPY